MKLLGMGLVWTGCAGAFMGAAATVRVSGWICAGIILGGVALLAAGAAVMLRLEREEREEQRKK